MVKGWNDAHKSEDAAPAMSDDAFEALANEPPKGVTNGR